MSEKTKNIIVYIPYKKDLLSEQDIHWINKFQTIINIGLKQILKTDFNLNIEFEDFAKKKNLDSLIITQTFLNNDLNNEFVLNENSDLNISGLINACAP